MSTEEKTDELEAQPLASEQHPAVALEPKQEVDGRRGDPLEALVGEGVDGIALALAREQGLAFGDGVQLPMIGLAVVDDGGRLRA